ncbi:hypothetical protein [Desulfocurvibacter africanus]|uniref:Alginate export domain-containing protein n=1 Tax=Desulfocurvibacter africanus subsp. africanus str. Walvis Bay TaxID=690850 RepID=F3YZY1_DESAF|nr:hypothetical protein [Desulfocurvibacter africanus]EGJ50936.1 hypothetical protein Desaf_2618 [Desulfocurvibacter africanus subsp. africanus str. Walvis Bay]
MRSAFFTPIAKPLMATLAALMFLAHALCPAIALAQDAEGDEYDLDFEIPEAETPKPFNLWGRVEQRSIARFLDTDALLYKQRFYQEPEDSLLADFLLSLKPEVSYKWTEVSLYARPRFDIAWSEAKRGGTAPDEPSEEFLRDEEHWASQVLLEEGFATWRPSHAFTLEAGKKVLNWGKGYAWNPVAFVSRPKDVDDPDYARQGYVLAYADVIKSFDGPLTTIAFTPVLVPVGEDVNADLADDGSPVYAGKLYFLLMDTDIDLLFATGEDYDTRYGLDFSRNLSSNLEIHGEAALRLDYDKTLTDTQGNLRTERHDAYSFLLGLRYLNAYDTTFIAEYYHNGEGYSPSEMDDYFTLIENGYAQYLETGNDRLLKRSNLAGQDFNQSSLGRNYLYFRVSQKEPFDILYLTPTLTVIANLGDHSFSINPEVSYLIRSDLELRTRLIMPFGPEKSEFGEKLQDARTEFWITYFF